MVKMYSEMEFKGFVDEMNKADKKVEEIKNRPNPFELDDKITMVSPYGVLHEMKVGISWTTAFFGPLPQLFRGNFGEFIKFIVLTFVTLGVWWLIQIFTTNTKEIEKYVDMGYIPEKEYERRVLAGKGFNFSRGSSKEGKEKERNRKREEQEEKKETPKFAKINLETGEIIKEN